jgi:hypothetical protein
MPAVPRIAFRLGSAEGGSPSKIVSNVSEEAKRGSGDPHSFALPLWLPRHSARVWLGEVDWRDGTAMYRDYSGPATTP